MTNRPKYLVAEMTRLGPDDVPPAHPFSGLLPLYIGMGPEVPRGTFTCNGVNMTVLDTFPPNHPQNPLGLQVVMACRVRLGRRTPHDHRWHTDRTGLVDTCLLCGDVRA